MERNDFMVILSIIASIITVSTFLAFVIYPLHHPEVTSTQPTQPTPTAASIVTSTPQITLSPSPTVTPTPVVTPTQTPLHEPKYSHGDIVTSTPSEAGRWHSVITFTGSGDKETAPFTIRGDEWRVKWSVSSSSNSPFFYVYVYPWGRPGGSVSYWLCIKASFSDIKYIDEGAGDYHFNIGAENRDSWKLEVEDYY